MPALLCSSRIPCETLTQINPVLHGAVLLWLLGTASLTQAPPIRDFPFQLKVCKETDQTTHSQCCRVQHPPALSPLVSPSIPAPVLAAISGS